MTRHGLRLLAVLLTAGLLSGAERSPKQGHRAEDVESMILDVNGDFSFNSMPELSDAILTNDVRRETLIVKQPDAAVLPLLTIYRATVLAIQRVRTKDFQGIRVVRVTRRTLRILLERECISRTAIRSSGRIHAYPPR